MKANEFMIGDWFQTTNPTGKVEFRKVEGVMQNHIVCNNGVTNAIEPIPLSPEIFEKNGFIGKEEGHYYSYHIRYGRLSNEIFDVHYQNHWIACSTPDNRDEFALFGMIILRYVHDLQHALRLCGIDKEIVL